MNRFRIKSIFVTFALVNMLCLISLSCSPTSVSKPTAHLATSAVVPDYIYYNKQHIYAIQQQISTGNPIYLKALQTLEQKATLDIKKPIESVLDKPEAPASGNKHDYLSLAPYFWPNPETPDGLPWINKDGQVNPMTRGKHTDQERSSKFLDALNTYLIVYTYTNNEQYLARIHSYIDTWMVNPNTRMNPHLNYAQGWPGTNNGTNFGVIEWVSISNVVSAMQLLKATKKVDNDFIVQVDSWLGDYLTWLLTSELGELERTRKNNHGSWYDYQVVGLMLYLNKIHEVKAYLETTKQRIEEHFLSDGSQPHELKRTKSVNYSSMNLQALVQVAYMGQKVGVNLLDFNGSQGQNLTKGIGYFYPYLRGEKTWEYKQISKTVEQAFEGKSYPMLHIARAHFGKDTVPDDIYNKVKITLSAEYILLYYAD